MLSPERRTALVIGHPGHELRVFHWLEIVKPAVFVLTDGSGHAGQSRLESTTRILNQAGARQGSFYGRFTDAAAYAAILNRNSEIFFDLARALARHLVAEQIEYVAGDALEGYNPSHDVCRLVINSAVELARRFGNQRVGNFEFPLTGPPDGAGHTSGAESVLLQLDDDAFARKMAAARSYAELESEVHEAITLNPVEAFRVECLHAVDNQQPDYAFAEKPYYEQYGEKQVAAGHYRDVIRYREHFLPLAGALRRQIEKGI